MYFPIIRGRQYDLLAIRELQSKGLLSEKIIPIIEPIKLSPTLLSTVKAFEDAERKLAIITNPKVGSFTGELKFESVFKQYLQMMSSDHVLVCHYLNKESEEQIDEIINTFKSDLEELILIHSERNLVSLYNSIYDSVLPLANVIPQDTSFRRQMRGKNLVGLDDKFNKLLRNADYLEAEQEFFSEEHLYFNDEGYIGFSDYSIIGADYNESGFAPYAVAIHIVFPNSEDALEIRHFVSDSNEDTSDPAGKFAEALEKMMKWYSESTLGESMETYALDVFKAHYKEGTYPGLPTIKKLSIMHHLELIGNLLR
ncbi:MAG TPA: sce7725 family protein [Bacillus sp. (in: firmicutes)]|nr:sce7725 family protein [Bacillus sp. (in: firmicutes)]